jgi:hypothetical protein
MSKEDKELDETTKRIINKSCKLFDFLKEGERFVVEDICSLIAVSNYLFDLWEKKGEIPTTFIAYRELIADMFEGLVTTLNGELVIKIFKEKLHKNQEKE